MQHEHTNLHRSAPAAATPSTTAAAATEAPTAAAATAVAATAAAAANLDNLPTAANLLIHCAQSLQAPVHRRLTGKVVPLIGQVQGDIPALVESPCTVLGHWDLRHNPSSSRRMRWDVKVSRHMALDQQEVLRLVEQHSVALGWMTRVPQD